MVYIRIGNRLYRVEAAFDYQLDVACSQSIDSLGLSVSVTRPKDKKAYLQRRHRSGCSGATHGAVLELLFFGAHLDGFKMVKGTERW